MQKKCNLHKNHIYASHLPRGSVFELAATKLRGGCGAIISSHRRRGAMHPGVLGFFFHAVNVFFWQILTFYEVISQKSHFAYLLITSQTNVLPSLPVEGSRYLCLSTPKKLIQSPPMQPILPTEVSIDPAPPNSEGYASKQPGGGGGQEGTPGDG